MRRAFEFPISPQLASHKKSSDEDLIERRPILSLILAAVLQTSVRYSPETKPRLTRLDIMKLVASGLPDSVVLRAIEISDTPLDGGKHVQDSKAKLRKLFINETFI
jgi:hypothetical protein